MRRAIIAYLVLAVPLAADMLSFDSAEEWAQWQQPFGLVQVGEQGQLSLVKFRKDINLVEDAHLFVHETRTNGAMPSPEVSGKPAPTRPTPRWPSTAIQRPIGNPARTTPARIGLSPST